jgi:voltage-gated potassium channel
MPFINKVIALFVSWLVFSGVIYYAEHGLENSSIQSYSDALYWAVAAISTAGIADAPISGIAKLVGGIWIVLCSVLFFGAIVATVTTYFMRPMVSTT